MAFNFRSLLGKSSSDEDYFEIDVNAGVPEENKVVVKPFILKEFNDINEILNSLREGYTIAVIDIKPLKQKDIIELKRAISKIKKTVDALEGSIAGFGEHTIIATPQFAKIHRAPMAPPKAKDKSSDFLG
jgi:SepF-like predicted cell division protein (DUF552 family)